MKTEQEIADSFDKALSDAKAAAREITANLPPGEERDKAMKERVIRYCCRYTMNDGTFFYGALAAYLEPIDWKGT